MRGRGTQGGLAAPEVVGGQAKMCSIPAVGDGSAARDFEVTAASAAKG